MQLSDVTFQRYSQWMKAQTGVHFTDIKKTLVNQRLLRRLHARNVATFEAYFRLLTHINEDAERQLALDLLTTHETFFFREPKHFEWLKRYLSHSRPQGKALRIWSAAASSGEEVWSIAMLLAEHLGVQGPWQLVGSDISQPVIEKAKCGHYVMQRCDGIPNHYLRKFCLKGQGTQHNTLLIISELRQRVEFKVMNLIEDFPKTTPFDVIFLRNVLIYFDNATKAQVVHRCIQCLQPGGFLLVSHSESLNGLCAQLTLIQAGVYQKK